MCLVVVVMVSSTVLPTFYETSGRSYPDGLPLLEGLACGAGAWAWLYAYASRHKIALPLDAGWLVLVAWWVVVPYYLLRARGRRAWIPIAAFGAVWAAAYALALLVWSAAS